MKNLSLVIINYNDVESTKKLIENTKDYKCLDFILIVDNHSTDDSVKQLKKLRSDKVRLLENKENKGYAYGLNTGAKYIQKLNKNSDIIFSNSDVIIAEEQDLLDLRKHLSDKQVVIGPTIVEGHHLNRGYRNSSITKEILYNLPLISRYIIDKTRYYKEKHYKSDTSTVDFVSGCFFLIKGNILKDIGYFDENTFLYYEENILGKKLESKKLQTIVDNKIVIIHEHSVTIDKNINKIRKQKILKESQQYFVSKYLDANKIQLFLLKITRNIGLLSLKIRMFFKRK